VSFPTDDEGLKRTNTWREEGERRFGLQVGKWGDQVLCTVSSCVFLSLDVDGWLDFGEDVAQQ